MKPILLKIGGSVLTDKERECTLRESEIERIAGEIGDSRARLVIIHGAGSFGHPQAKEHRIGEDSTTRGLIETHRAVMKLNNAIIEALNRAGLDAIGVHPLDFIMMRENRVAHLDSAVIEKMIEFGLTPVLHGDVVMDSEKGASVISGDQILRELGSRLEVSRVGAGTNVDGVLDKRGRTIARITPETFNHLSLRQRDEYSSVDVTGEMRGKVKELLELAENGVESLIFNASRDKMVYNFLRGKDVGGTRITPQ
ncbi:Isopentenyl phosphate kinase [Candidatus Methanoperedenaceae archaeon GB50]|nr:Isopentenyl phosphate kinase [Candidatus Methanoperedenaceae archaeon GB50]CAD7780574.1 MAG: Isopentenyl phosphate kinase [Candidatus Methanoperedenaceae archaeon GB50]